MTDSIDQNSRTTGEGQTSQTEGVNKMEDKISAAIKNAIDNAPERKFVESIEFSFTIKDVDLKNPNNRIQEEVRLPSGRGKDVKVAMFATADAAQKAEAAGIHVIDPTTIEDLGGKRGDAKRLANRFDFFLSEVPHMGLIGRHLGVVLGPRGKCHVQFPQLSIPELLRKDCKAQWSSKAVIRLLSMHRLER